MKKYEEFELKIVLLNGDIFTDSSELDKVSDPYGDGTNWWDS